MKLPDELVERAAKAAWEAFLKYTAIGGYDWPMVVRKISDSALEAALSEGGEVEWRCQHGRGGERLCREVNAYEPSLHQNCGKVLVIRLDALDSKE